MDLAARADTLAQLMEERLGLRGAGLAAKTRRAGRRLPRWVRREIGKLLEALELADHPRLQQRIEPETLERGLSRVETWLTAIDPAERRLRIVLGWLAENVLRLLAVFVLVVAVLAWRGFL